LKKQRDALTEKPENYKRQEKHNAIDCSYAGGADGNEITYKIIDQVKVKL
jgi:hypothetical protein